MNNQNSDGLENAAVPQLCQKGCGFFRNGGGLYCSKCAKEVAAQEEKARATERATEASASIIVASLQDSQPAIPASASAHAAVNIDSKAVISVEMEASVAPVEQAATPAAQESPSAPPNPNRCFQCKKRVGLTGFKCKCERVFCGSHRMAESHDCPFDYKTAQRAQLAEANPVIHAAKVQKI